jgi:hypothetical protein
VPKGTIEWTDDNAMRYLDELEAEIERLSVNEDMLHAEVSGCLERIDELQIEVERMRGAIEYAFENASNSFLGVCFSFDAVKKLRAALEVQSNV